MDWSKAERVLARRDRALGRVIRAVGPCRLAPSRYTIYEALCRSVAFQQVHGKAGQAILDRLLALGPARRFPSPAVLLALPPGSLRGCGFSANKALALQDIAARTLDGTLPDRRACARLDDEEIITRLTVARGVGRWTAEMVLMFTLARPDVLPVGDFGIREGYRLLHGLKDPPSPQELVLAGRKWSPWRTPASWYLWRAVELYRV